MTTSDELVATLDEAVTGALRALVGVESAVRTAGAASALEGFADVSAVLVVTTRAGEGYFVLSFTGAVGTALAKLILADVTAAPDPEMMRDCLGEVVNVIAGQAKTLLVGTPLHFVLGTPTVATGPPALAVLSRVLVAFTSDIGEFTLHVRLPA
ncbi:chemotaxis protein CheX [Gemmata sp. G18]|uniref:Chemotaxis protein CheX n=1 Tax=Gemmata palustris TaxID=2822762 RepID=A0ABS5BKJ2_9BACT|nr:chemotaxis protein CheX [Gemmata palustris]MBP3954226.1 chemotaxis protein CheX [Gemmata palustris]